jgi:chromate transport protein ChrA
MDVKGSLQMANTAKTAIVTGASQGIAPIVALKVDEWDRQLDVNIKGLLYGVAAALPHMKTARMGAGLTVVWMSAVILSHIFVLGYGWSFVDALMVMVLAVIYLLLTRRHSHCGEPESVGTLTNAQKNSRANSWKRSPQGPDNNANQQLFRWAPVRIWMTGYSDCDPREWVGLESAIRSAR